MPPMNRMKPSEMVAYVGFGEAEQVHLRALWPHVEPELDRVCAAFYERALSNPVTSAVLGDAGRVNRLMATLRVWLMELLNGPWDAGYWERRSRIGHRHVEINLPPGAMFTAMSVIREEVARIISERSEHKTETLIALCKVTELDLGVMTGTYYDEQRERLLSELETLIVSNIQAPAILLDSNDIVTAATPAMERLAEARTLIGRPLKDSLPPALIEAADLVYHLAHARSRRRSVTLPRVDLTLGGREVHLAITVVPLDHPRADVLVQVEDQTDAILAEARLRKQENLAQLGTLAATVAHELRNPLAGISGALQVLSRGFEPDDRRAAVMKKVMEQVHGLDSLVSDLLAFVRPKEPRREAVVLHEVVTGVVENASMRFGTIRIGFAGDGVAMGDTEMVRQILLNLVINGCQAAGDGGEVWIDVAGDGVTVSDSGSGLSSEARERLFEPFFTTRTHGTGLGLANSMLLAQSMGARLLLLDKGRLSGASFQLLLRPMSPLA